MANSTSEINFYIDLDENKVPENIATLLGMDTDYACQVYLFPAKGELQADIDRLP